MSAQKELNESTIITFFQNAMSFQAHIWQSHIAVDRIVDSEHDKKMLALYRAMEPGKKKDKTKKEFPAVCWSVTKYKDNHRAAANCIKHSGLIVIDIDKLTPEKYSYLLNAIKNDATTHICFTSLSGNGIKVVIKIEADPAKHLLYFNSIASWYKLSYDIDIDASGKDVSRLCFICHDPNCYYFPDSDVWPVPDPANPLLAVVEIIAEKPITLSTQQQQNLRKNTGTSANDVFEFTQNIRKYTDGNRNNFVHLYACNCNRKGLDQAEVESFAYGFAADLDAKEVKATVNSAYQNNKSEYGKFAKKIKASTGLAGKNGKPAPADNNKKTGSPAPGNNLPGSGGPAGIPVPKTTGVRFNGSGTQAQQSPVGDDQEKKTPIEFWHKIIEEDKAGKKTTKYSLDYIRFFDFLEAEGFHRLPLEKNSFDLIKYRDNICAPQMPHNIQDFINQWCKENDQLGVLAMIRKGAKTYFAVPQFNNLNYKPIEFARDTQTQAFFYFSNGIAEVTAEGIHLHEYKKHNKSIWQSQIIDHELKILPDALPMKGNEIDFDAMPCEFAKFIARASSSPKHKEISADTRERRYLSFCSSIGYMLHDFKTKIGKAVIAVDHKMAIDRTEQNGGTGKSIVGISFKYLKKIAMIDGREFKEDYPFKYDMLESDTKIIVMQDCRHNLDFGSFFVPLTNDFTYNRRNIGFRTIKYEDSPKFWFDTNFTFKGDGPSFRRRQHVIEFDDYYNEDHTPFDDFGHYMFTDWNTEQMNHFFNFMLQCVQIYLAQGLLPYPGGHYDERKLVNECPVEFLDFMDAKDDTGKFIIPRNKELLKTELLKQWTEQCKSLNMQNTSSHMFSKFVKKYAKTRGLFFHSKKTNSKEYYALADKESAAIEPYQASLFEPNKTW